MVWRMRFAILSSGADGVCPIALLTMGVCGVSSRSLCRVRRLGKWRWWQS